MVLVKAGSGSAEVENILLHIEADFEMSVFAIFLRLFKLIWLLVKAVSGSAEVEKGPLVCGLQELPANCTDEIV